MDDEDVVKGMAVKTLDWFLAWTGWSSLLPDQRFVDVRNNTTTSNGSLDQWIKFFVSSDGQLKMPWSDSLHFQILGCISRQLQNLFNKRIISAQNPGIETRTKKLVPWYSLQRSNTQGWLQSRQRRWHQHVHGLWFGSSSVCGYDQPGTAMEVDVLKMNSFVIIYFWTPLVDNSHRIPKYQSVGTLTWSPARADRETALAFAFPESFPALPPA